MSWVGFDPVPYTREQYQAHVESLPHLPWVKFIVLHNTGSPTLAQWMDAGVSEVQRLLNLEHYYEVTERWHAGPHGFISPTHICGFSDPTKPGVHASCFNPVSLGFEMVGDFSTESFDSGPGAQVRDNAVFTLAVWYRKLGLRPDGYQYGVRGLHFHKDCIRDHHSCPGKNVDRDDMVRRVLAKMGVSSGPATPLTPFPLAPAPPTIPALSSYLRVGSTGDLVKKVQEALGSSLVVGDGVFGHMTEEAVEKYQTAHNLIADGIVGPKTLAAMGLTPQETAP